MTGWNGCPFTVIRNKTEVQVYSSLLDSAETALLLYRRLRKELDEPESTLRFTYSQARYRIAIECPNEDIAEMVRDDIKRLAEQDGLGVAAAKAVRE